MFSTSANAQIVYTNVTPDDTVTCSTAPCSDSYNLDLNNDGTIDFQITYIKGSQGGTNACTQRVKYSMSIVPLNSNAIIFADSTSLFAAKLDSNKIIKNTSVWKNSSAYLKYTRWNSQAFTGCFANNYGWSGTNNSQSQNGYVGLKLVIGNNKYFGWIKLNVYGTFGGNPSGQWGRCIVIDFAYDSTPNHSIHAGATSGARLSTDFLTNGITYLNNIQIAPNPFSNSTTISFSMMQSEKVSINIFDMTGRIVKTIADAEMQEGAQQIEWNTMDEKGNAVDAGIYLLKLDAGNYCETKKLSVIK